MTRITIVNAGMSEDSATARLGRAVETALRDSRGADAGELRITWVNLRTLARPIADHLVTGFPNRVLAEALGQVSEADALVVLTPVYQGSYSGLFKSFFDLVEEGAVEGKPVLLGATGGTPRHSLVTEHALRPLFTYMRALVIPTAVFVATEDWGAHASDSRGDAGAKLHQRLQRAATQLLGFTGVGSSASVASAQALAAGGRDAEVPDFEALLHGLARR